MTLIISSINSEQAVLASDRRVICNGKPKNEEYNKAAVLICRDARVAVAFTGIAQQGEFLTRRWLLEALVESAGPDYRVHSLIDRLSARASKDIGKLRVNNPSDKRLTVVLTGYVYDDSPPRCYCWLVSNFERFDGEEPPIEHPAPNFFVSFMRDKRPAESEPYCLLPAGYRDAVKIADMRAIETLLKQKKPAQAIVEKSVQVIRATAESEAAKASIGKQCMSIILPSEPDRQAAVQYHTSVVSKKIFGAAVIEARGGEYGSYIIADPEYEERDQQNNSKILAVPKVGKNQLCPCRSGKKYKRCHGA
jgi:SEC-C motif-containing protein